MPRLPRSTQDLYALLRAAGVSIEARPLQRALEDGLGPLGDLDMKQTVDHWRTAAPHFGRGRSYDEAAIALAQAGFPCARLPAALLRTAGVEDLAESTGGITEISIEDRAEMVIAATDEWSRSLLAFLRANSRSGPGLAYSSRDPDDDPGEGRLHSALADASGAMRGAPAEDIEDIAAVVGLPVDRVSTVVDEVHQASDGQPLLVTGAGVVSSVDAETLVAVVRIVSASIPVAEEHGVPMPPGEMGWATFATAVVGLAPMLAPLVGKVADVIGESVSTVGSKLADATALPLNPEAPRTDQDP